MKTKNSASRGNFRTAIILCIVTALVVCGAVVVLPKARDFIANRNIPDYEGSGNGEVVVVNIPEGSLGADIANILYKEDVVASQMAFIKAFNKNPKAGSIQAGSYKLQKKMSAANAVAALLAPANRAELTVTIPEGFTAQQIYERLANVLSLPLEEIKAAAADPAALGLPKEAGGNLEGWLAPKTYEYAPGTTAQAALSQLVEERIKEMQSLGVPKDNWQHYIVIASIVEREVNWPEHYGKVARVIENRLALSGEAHGCLQMDSTVLYGVGKSGGVPTQSDLESDNPYNTYKHPGLPPAPISNPSISAIKATINPPAGNWIYFVTVNLHTGETKFTDNLEEHNKNVQEFRKWFENNNDEKSK